jgi:hypothetical protein
MAFNRKYFNIFKYLLPKAEAFLIIIQKKLTQFFEGLTSIPDDFRKFIDNIFLDLFPATTRSLESWEEQFAILRPSGVESIRRNAVDLAWKLKGGQSREYLQTKLQEAGFDLQVHENNPVIDPANFISSGFVMTCGDSWGVCGNDDAFCGKSGGYLLVNGLLWATVETRDYLMVCGGNILVPTCCGQSIAVCGFFINLLTAAKQSKIYILPVDSDYWGAVFFIGGNASRNYVTHELEAIETKYIENTRRNELESLILKIKPVNTWAGMLVDYTG